MTSSSCCGLLELAGEILNKPYCPDVRFCVYRCCCTFWKQSSLIGSKTGWRNSNSVKTDLLGHKRKYCFWNDFSLQFLSVLFQIFWMEIDCNWSILIQKSCYCFFFPTNFFSIWILGEVEGVGVYKEATCWTQNVKFREKRAFHPWARSTHFPLETKLYTCTKASIVPPPSGGVPLIPKEALQKLVPTETLEPMLHVIPTQEILFEWPAVFAWSVTLKVRQMGSPSPSSAPAHFTTIPIWEKI